MKHKSRLISILVLMVFVSLGTSYLATPQKVVYAAAPDYTVAVVTTQPVPFQEAGTANTFTVRISNIGDAASADPATITANLSGAPGLTYASSNVGATGFNCAASSGTTLSCTKAAGMGIGETN